MKTARRLRYQPRLDLVFNFGRHASNDPYARGPAAYWAKVWLFDGGPDLPEIVVAQHVARHSCNLRYVANELRDSPFLRMVVDPDAAIWINHTDGPLGSYSRRSERIDLVDFDAQGTGKFGHELASTRMTRRQVEEQFGLEFPEGPARREDYREAPRLFEGWLRRVIAVSRECDRHHPPPFEEQRPMKPTRPARPIAIYDPGVRPEDEPEVAPCLINGRPYNVLRWSPEQWARLPEGRRPGDAFEGSKGGWFRFEPDDD